MMWGWNVSCCRWQVVVFWLLAITGCLVDLGSKEWVFAALPEEDFSSPEQYAGVHHSQYIGAHHTLWQASGDNTDNQLVPPGFHLHIAYRVDAEGHQVPHVNQGALFGLGGQAWGGVANGVFALVSLVVQRRFAHLAMKHGGSVVNSIVWTLVSTFSAMLAMVISLPLWVVPPLMFIVPPIIWGWLSYRVMVFDALVSHASRDERIAIGSKHRLPLLLIGNHVLAPLL